jgi:hypothetical protein
MCINARIRGSDWPGLLIDATSKKLLQARLDDVMRGSEDIPVASEAHRHHSSCGGRRRKDGEVGKGGGGDGGRRGVEGTSEPHIFLFLVQTSDSSPAQSPVFGQLLTMAALQ